ncbi:hypothetical protein [Lysobacter gummosus]|uniref:hypothetical protein n=1 Tax=Lysobacter gummosus TaxID=262324 RepID=UPI0036457A5D
MPAVGVVTQFGVAARDGGVFDAQIAIGVAADAQARARGYPPADGCGFGRVSDQSRRHGRILRAVGRTRQRVARRKSDARAGSERRPPSTVAHCSLPRTGGRRRRVRLRGRSRARRRC